MVEPISDASRKIIEVAKDGINKAYCELGAFDHCLGILKTELCTSNSYADAMEQLRMAKRRMIMTINALDEVLEGK